MPSTLGWVATFLLAAAVFLIPSGRFADPCGRKRVFIAGLLLFSSTSLLIALSSSAAPLIALRVVQGLGAAMRFGASTAILTSVFGPGDGGKVIRVCWPHRWFQEIIRNS